MDLHYKISQWPSQDASDKDKRIAELEKLVGDSERRWASELNERVYKIAELERELAAAQATIQQMREAIALLLYEVDESGNGAAQDFGWPEATVAARDALALPADRTALDAMLADARKEGMLKAADIDVALSQTYMDSRLHTDQEKAFLMAAVTSFADAIRQAAERSE